MSQHLAQSIINGSSEATTITLQRGTAEGPSLGLQGTALEIWLSLWNLLTYELSLGDGKISIIGLITLLLMLLPAYFLSRGFQGVLENQILSRIPALTHANKFLIMKVTHYVIMVVAFLVILSTAGINLNSLTVIFGLLSVGIGFGLQNLAANFISGIIMLVEQPIKVGDWVEVNDKEGEVVDINLRATHIETNDAVHIIIPNQEILGNNIVNNSQGRPYFRVHTAIGVTYKADMNLVHRVLLEVAKKNRKTLDYPEPEVWMVGHGNSSVDWEILIWIRTPKDRIRTQSELYLAAWWALKENDIEIPFPQRDLHLRSSDIPLPYQGPTEARQLNAPQDQE